MAEKNVITILVQAIDRASRVIRGTATEVENLEKAENKTAVSTQKLDRQQASLNKTFADSNKQLSLLDTKQSSVSRTTDTHASNVRELRSEMEKLNTTAEKQLSFFGKLNAANRIVSTQRGFSELLRDISGEPMTLGGLRRGGKGVPKPQGVGGLPGLFGGSDEMERTGASLDDINETLQGMQKTAGQLELFPNLNDKVRALREIERDRLRFGEGTPEGFGTAEQRKNSELLQLLKDIVTARRLNNRELVEYDRMHVVRMIEGEANALRRLRKEQILPDDIANTTSRIRNLQLLRRAVKDGTVDFNEFRTVLRSIEGDGAFERMEARIRPVNRAINNVENGMRRVRRWVGITDKDFDRFAAKRVKDLNDLTSLDETLQVAFRRIARIIAVITTLLPFITVGLGLIIGAVTSLIGGVTALAGAFTNLAGVVAALPTLFVATFGAIGATVATLGISIQEIQSRFTEARQVQESARKQTTENAKSLRDAEQALGEARVNAAEQVADAEKRIAETRQKNLESIADQERDLRRLRVTNAEQEKDLVRDIRDAKLDAAKKAKEAEKQYQELLKKNREDEQEIITDITTRRAQLGALRMQGADPFTIGQAQAGVTNAEKNYRQVRAANAKEERTAATAVRDARIDGVKRVAELERRLARTKRDNQQQEADAERRLYRTRRDGTQDIIDLETQLARTRRDSAQAVRDAQENLIAQQKKARGDLTDTLAGLPPLEKAIVQQMLRIREEWVRLTSGVRDRALTIAQRALSLVENNLPAIANRMSQFTNVVLDKADAAITRFTSPDRVDRFNRILDSALGITNQLGDAMLDVADAILIVADVARPVATRLSQIVRDAAAAVRKSAAKNEKSGNLDDFFATTNRVLDLTIESLRNLGLALKNVLKIGSDAGEELLVAFRNWTQEVENFTSSTQGQKDIASFFEDAVPIFEDLVSLAKEFVKQLFLIGRDLMRPTEGGGKSFLEQTIEGMTASLPAFRKFIVESTLQNGPALLKFLRDFGILIGKFVGPGGIMVQFLTILGKAIELINKMPDWLAKAIYGWIVFGGVIQGLARSFRLFISFASILAPRLAAILLGMKSLSGFKWAGLFTPGPIKALITLFLIYPTLFKPVQKAFNLLLDAVKALLWPFEQLLNLFGTSEKTVDSLGTSVLQLAGTFLILSGGRGIGTFFKTLKALVTGQGLGGLGKALKSGGGIGQWLFGTDSIKQPVSRFNAAIESIKKGIASLGKALTGAKIKEFFLTLKAGAVTSMAAMRAALVATARSVFLFSKAVFAAFLTPPLSIVLAIGAAVTAIVLLYRKSETFRRVVKIVMREAANAVADFLRVWTFTLDKFLGGLSTLAGWASKIDPTGFFADIQHGIDKGREVVRGAIDMIDSLGENSDAGIKGGEKIGKNVVTGVTRGLSAFSGVAGNEIRKSFIQLENELTAQGGILETKGRTLAERIVQAFVAPFDKMLAGETPAAREIARIEARRTARQRTEQKTEAQNQVKTAQAAYDAAAKKRAAIFARISQPGGGGLSREAGQRLYAEADAEVKTKAKALAAAKSARFNTLRDIAEEEQIEKLRILDAQQRKEMQQQRKNALAQGTAFAKALTQAIKTAANDPDNIGKLEAAKRTLMGVWEKLPESVRVNVQVPFEKATKTLDGMLTKAKEVEKYLAQDKKVRTIIIAGDKVFGLPTKRRAAGGVIDGPYGNGVPIVAHAGEWVLNRSQQLKAAMLAGTDRSILERALFHRIHPNSPRLHFASGGVVPSSNGAGTNVVNNVTVNNPAAPLDPNYIARMLEARMRSVTI